VIGEHRSHGKERIALRRTPRKHGQAPARLQHTPALAQRPRRIREERDRQAADDGIKDAGGEGQRLCIGLIQAHVGMCRASQPFRGAREHRRRQIDRRYPACRPHRAGQRLRQVAGGAGEVQHSCAGRGTHGVRHQLGCAAVLHRELMLPASPGRRPLAPDLDRGFRHRSFIPGGARRTMRHLSMGTRGKAEPPLVAQ